MHGWSGGPAPLLLGFLLGMRHALDADHLAAMTAIVSRERRVFRSALFGGWWGAGHLSALFAVGLAVLAFGLPAGVVAGAGPEAVVGVMLVLLGLSSLAAALRPGDRTAGAAPARGLEPAEPAPAPAPMISTRRPFAVGLIHGLAGSGALALLVLATIPSRAAGLLYIVLFGLGAVGGMMAMAGLLAVPFALAGRQRGARAHWLPAAAGLANVAFGAWYLYRAA